MTLLILAASASASSSIGSNACVNATPATQAACDCVFSSNAYDWLNPNNSFDPIDTCFEFDLIVNDVPASNRATALFRISQIALTFECVQHEEDLIARDFEPTVDWSSGVVGQGIPWVQGQQLTSVQEEECGLGNGAEGLRATFVDDTWMLTDGDGVLRARTASYKGHIQVAAYSLDEDGDEDEDDLLVLWDDGTMWIAYGVNPDEIIEPIEFTEDW